MKTATRRRQPEALVAPGITFAAVLLMLVAARLYDRLPVTLPDCGFLLRTGLPCPGCGGTRAMAALSAGDPATALRYHPLAALAVFAAAVWLLLRLGRFWVGRPIPTLTNWNRRGISTLLIATLLLTANWIYLIVFLP